jgi:hypothetical protein
MAINLAKAGYTVLPFDLNPDNLLKLENQNF